MLRAIQRNAPPGLVYPASSNSAVPRLVPRLITEELSFVFLHTAAFCRIGTRWRRAALAV